MRNRRLWVVALSWAVVLAMPHDFGPPVAASNDSPATDMTKEVRGMVSDPQPAVIVGAKITASRRGRTYEATSDDAGQFLLQLPAGTYHVRVSSPGFRPWSTTLKVRVNDGPLELILTLEPGPPECERGIGANQRALRPGALSN